MNYSHERRNDRNQKSKIILTLQNALKTLKLTVENQLKLKKLIQRAQKIDFMSNVLPQDKLDMYQSLYMNIFLLFNSVVVGAGMFGKKQYRNLKYFSIYMLSITYLGLSFGIFWEDQSFLDKISTQDDAYKSEIKYLFRKECLQNVQNLDRIQRRKQLFNKLNSQFQNFHSVIQNSNKLSLIP